MLRTTIPPKYRCTKCKNECLHKVRNGDLYCCMCQSYCEPEEQHLLEYALYSDEVISWKSNKNST